MDPSVDTSGHRLLIIDDDPSIGMMIARVAGRAGYQTLVVSTPDDFLQRVRIWAPTHIVMDLQMPVVDGLELLSQLASDHNTARIILISGAGDRVVDAARRVGTARGLSVTAALNKPFSIAELEMVLHANRLEDPWLTVANLSAAIERDEFFLLYQPQVDLRSGAVRAAEALVRWRHPVRGVVSPLEFIPFAESSACIDRMTQWIVTAACGQLKRWDAIGMPMRLAINLSARNLHEARLGDQLEAQCRGAGIDPGRLTFELTETAAMRDAMLMTDALTRLRVKGFGLSIDDFGTGYSSLVLLHRLPFTELKIDRSFVATVATSKESRAIVRMVIDLAHALDLQTVAEGVESADVMRLLRELNCDAAQGTFVALPLEADQVPDMVRGQSEAAWYRAGVPWAVAG